MYTYRYIVCTFSDQLWKRFDRSIVHSSAPYSSLRQEGTSDSSLKKVQVATKLDFLWEKYVIIRLLPGSLCDSHCITIGHRL